MISQLFAKIMIADRPVTFIRKLFKMAQNSPCSSAITLL